MIRYSLFALLSACSLPLLLNGCGSNVDMVTGSFWERDKTITYGAAFSTAFENGTWSEVQIDKKEKGVQFTGRISPGLHYYALENLNKNDARIQFSSAFNYLATLIKKGKVSNDKEITFDIRNYPINKSGMIIYDIMEDYLSSKDNIEKRNTLISFYRKRYWEAGSNVLFLWQVYAHGKILRVVKVSNPHWDDDVLFSNKPDNILKMVFDYAKSKSR
jgi:hypothetical protein